MVSCIPLCRIWGETSFHTLCDAQNQMGSKPRGGRRQGSNRPHSGPQITSSGDPEEPVGGQLCGFGFSIQTRVSDSSNTQTHTHPAACVCVCVSFKEMLWFCSTGQETGLVCLSLHSFCQTSPAPRLPQTDFCSIIL